ncbi:MAG: hypothetical protein ACUVQ5_01045 [Candidatus Methanomethylicaceae archaeon]
MTLSSKLKESIWDLIEVLSMLRKTSPHHRLGEKEREELIKSLDRAIARLNELKEEIKNEVT